MDRRNSKATYSTVEPAVWADRLRALQRLRNHDVTAEARRTFTLAHFSNGNGASAPDSDLSTASSPAMPRILLVEDHDLTRQLIPAMLKREAEVEAVATVNDAIDRAENATFDLFLVDINLGPGGSGFDVLHAIRQHPDYKTTPVVACTAFAMAGDRERFLEAGFDAYLSKPFEKKQLQDVIQAELRY